MKGWTTSLLRSLPLLRTQSAGLTPRKGDRGRWNSRSDSNLSCLDDSPTVFDFFSCCCYVRRSRFLSHREIARRPGVKWYSQDNDEVAETRCRRIMTFQQFSCEIGTRATSRARTAGASGRRTGRMCSASAVCSGSRARWCVVALCMWAKNLAVTCSRAQVDLSREYWTRVFEPALELWESGHTPNPDVWCNKCVWLSCFKYTHLQIRKGSQIRRVV